MTDPARGAERAFIGLGANLGDPWHALDAAVAAIGTLPATRVGARSARYRSSPVDADGPDYLNQVVEVATTLEPDSLLAGLHRIEHLAGRERGARNAPRPLDLDLLSYGDPPIMLDTETLTLPHPRLHERLFVLMPLAELAPAMTLPGSTRTVAQRLAELQASPAGRNQRCDRWLPPDGRLPYSAPPS